VKQKSYLLLCGVVLVLTAGYLAYSQTLAFAWDEGFHVLAAQLIYRGERPYLDFFFPQAALNAYFTAFWMRLFGDTWHTAHAFEAICACGAILLTGDYLYRRFPVSGWRPAAALIGAITVGFNVQVLEFGTVGQAYGFCLLMVVAAHRCAVIAVERERLGFTAAAGIFAGAGAASTLLSAPVAPVLLLWLLFYNQAGKRVRKSAVFLIAAALPFLPLIRLLILSPRQTVFNLFEYHMFYRQVQWEDAIPHDIGVMLAWVDSSQAFLLLLLAVLGVVFVRSRSGWSRSVRAEFYLCVWLALALAYHISSAHPTFQRYYLLTVPFLAILTAASVFWLAERLCSPGRVVLPVVAVTVLMAFSLVKCLYDQRDEYRWSTLEPVAEKVRQVTPASATLLADEHVYFLLRRRPPDGMELADSHKLELPSDFAHRMHIVDGSELRRRTQAGEFYTLENCQEDDQNEEDGIPKLYRNHAKVGECTVFWYPVRR
jgi:hypothetical protein